MKKIVKITILIAIILFAFYSINEVHAWDDVISAGDEFLHQGSGEEKIDTTAVQETSNYIYNILFTLAVVLSVAIGLVIGIQFMMGSVDEKAKIKETLIPYVIGVFVVFASFTIWKVVVELGNDISPTASVESINSEIGEKIHYC